MNIKILDLFILVLLLDLTGLEIVNIKKKLSKIQQKVS